MNTNCFGDYQLLEELGQGQFGEVWRAGDPRRGEEVALKILKVGNLDPKAIRRFKREFEILTSLHHPHLAQVFHFGYDKEGGRYFFTSEFCRGKDLARATEGRPVAFFEGMLVQVLSALDYIHSQGIVHLDIKPQNLLCDEVSGRPFLKIVDFGISTQVQAMPKGPAGTLAYMAPELIAQGTQVDYRADLYSLGMVCLRLLTRRWPFDIKNTSAVAEWQLRGKLPGAIWGGTDVPPYLQEFVGKLLEKQPSRRFSGARVALNFLNLATGGKYRKIERELVGDIPAVGPLVEREEVLEKVQAVFRTILSSQEGKEVSPVVFVSGEPGIGKSRLLEEVRHLVELAEVPIVEIGCDRKTPAWPQLALGLKLMTPEPPRIEDPLESIEEALPSNWNVLQRVDAMIEKGREKPVAILIDDLERAETEMREVVEMLAKRSRVPIFVVVTSEEPLDPQGVVLKRLTEKGVSHYVSHLIGEREGIGDLASILHLYSGGLPLLAAEGLRFLAPIFNRGEALEGKLPPPKVLLLYQEKIDALAPEQRQLLEIGALIYRPVSEEELAAILSCGPDQIHRLAEKSLATGLLRESGGIYRISSQALALDIIQSLEGTKKREFHARIVDGLEKSSAAQGGPSLEEIADHAAQAGRKEQARGLYLAASDKNRSLGQISRAVESVRKARTLSPEGAEDWASLSLDLTQLLILRGAFDEADGVLTKLDRHPSYRREELKGWLAYKKRRFAEAKRSYRSAVSLLSPEDRLHRVLIKNAVANVDLQSGQVPAAVISFEEALRDEESLPDGERLKVGNNNLGLALALSGDFDRAVRFFLDRIGRLDPGMIPERISLLNALGYVLIQASRFGEAADRLKNALELSESSGTYQVLFSLLGNLTHALLKETRYAEALAVFRKVAAYQERFGTPRDIAYNLLREGGVFLTLGMEEAAHDAFRKGRELVVSSDRLLAAWFLLMEGYREKDFGDLQRAVELFSKTLEEARRLKNGPLDAWSLYALGDIALERGDLVSCEARLQEIQPPAGDEEFGVRVDLLRARLRVDRGDDLGAEALLVSLEERAKAGSFRETLWEIYQVWGRLERRRGREERAAKLLEKGIGVIEANAASLPEEYRDRYLRRTSCRKLYQEIKEVKEMPPELIASKLLEINKKMATEHDPERLLEYIMDTAIEFSGAGQGLLLLVDPDGEFSPRVARNLQKENIEAIRFSRSVAVEVVKTGQPVFSLDIGQDDRLKAVESVVSLQLKTVACVPLQVRNRAIGVIYLDTDQKMPPLKKESLPMLQLFADQAAVALQNAFLFRENETNRLQLEKDLEETRSVLGVREEHLQELEALVSQASASPRKTLYPYEKIIGRSKKMEEILKTMDKITNAQVPVLVLGETGTGKELLARALHQNSVRKKNAFVAINCSAFPETLLESELFGYNKGAFTGADRDRKGLFEEADGGTLFLDEVADMSLAMQAKLLRVIQEREVMRVGGRVPIKVNVRIVSAANKDLKGLVREGKFREDLYFRLAGITIPLPPLRERKEDIPALVKHLVDKIRKENRLGPVKITRDAMGRMAVYEWPGNIRELEQCLTNACLLADGGAIKPEHLLLHTDLYKEKPPVGVGGGEGLGFDPEKKMEDYEREIILKTLEFCGGNKSEAARRLGLSRLTMHKKLKAYQVAM